MPCRPAALEQAAVSTNRRLRSLAKDGRLPARTAEAQNQDSCLAHVGQLQKESEATATVFLLLLLLLLRLLLLLPLLRLLVHLLSPLVLKNRPPLLLLLFRYCSARYARGLPRGGTCRSWSGPTRTIAPTTSQPALRRRSGGTFTCSSGPGAEGFPSANGLAGRLLWEGTWRCCSGCDGKAAPGTLERAPALRRCFLFLFVLFFFFFFFFLLLLLLSLCCCCCCFALSPLIPEDAWRENVHDLKERTRLFPRRSSPLSLSRSPGSLSPVTLIVINLFFFSPFFSCIVTDDRPTDRPTRHYANKHCTGKRGVTWPSSSGPGWRAAQSAPKRARRPRWVGTSTSSSG